MAKEKNRATGKINSRLVKENSFLFWKKEKIDRMISPTKAIDTNALENGKPINKRQKRKWNIWDRFFRRF